MNRETVQSRVSGQVCGWIVLAGLLLAGPMLFPLQAQATTIYSYIDEQGNPRFSDSMENIPEKYRAKVKTHEQASSQEKSPSVMDNMKTTATSFLAPFKLKAAEWLQGFGVTLPSASPKAAAAPSRSADMSTSQSTILSYAGGAAVVLLLLMYFSKSQLMRLLGLCLLITLGFATPILLYVSDDGPMTSMKGKATAAGQAQQDRLKQAAP